MHATMFLVPKCEGIIDVLGVEGSLTLIEKVDSIFVKVYLQQHTKPYTIIIPPSALLLCFVCCNRQFWLF